MMSDSGKSAAQRLLIRRRWVAVIFLTGAMLSVAFWLVLRAREKNLAKEKSEHQFEAAADVRIHSIKRRLEDDAKLIHFLQAFYAGSEKVTEDEFDEFVKPLLDGYRDIQALGTIRNDEFAPAFFVDRRQRSPEAVGFGDLAKATRKLAMDGARKTGEVTVTGRIDLPGEDRAGNGMIAFGIVPEKPFPVEGVSPPEFVVGVVSVDEAVRSVLEDYRSKPIRIAVFDAAAAPAKPSGWYRDMALEVSGATWIVRGTPTDVCLAKQITWLPMIALVSGLLITSLLTMYVNVLLGRTAEVEQMVVRRATQLKRASEDLEQERYLLHALMDNLPHLIYFKDTASRFIRINRAHAAWFGIDDASEALGKSDFDFFADEHARQARADELEVMRTGQPLLDKEEKETWTNGKITWAVTTKLPLFDDEGRVIGTFGISRDITDKKHAAEALRAAKEAAETASRAKSDFLAHMSHEIRTPMNAVIGMTELVLDTELNASQREYLRMVRESGESLLLVINDILDFSKIEAGRLELDCTPFALRESLGDTMKSLGLRAHGKGLELACHIHGDVPDGLIGDLGRLRQIVVNLVGNAIKFTAEGEVVLDVECESQSADESSSKEQAVLHFAVRDTGIGIPEDKQATIFDAFEQVDRTTTRRFGGTGLGLSITSKLVGCMNGRIWVESTVDRGSTFHFTAQFEPAPEVGPEMRPAQAVFLRNLKTLIVDDNGTNRQILQEMLLNWEMAPTSVGGADEAFDALCAAQAAGEPFQLVLTDANMPDVDGFTLAERIKQDSQLGSTASSAARGPVIMMLTSGDRPGDISRCEQLGVAVYLLKPIKQSELFDAIVMAMGISVVEDEDIAATTGKQDRWARPLRILLAEDSLVNQKLAVGLLERQGHSVVVANNGKEAVAFAELQDFDAILMDVQMPEMDGLEATALIRGKQKQTGLHTPIIAMTAHAMKGDRERCLNAGMDEYVPKPIRAKRFFDTIRSVLGELIEADAQSDVPPSPMPADTSPWLCDSLNWEEALSTVKGDQDLLKEVVKAFLGEVPGLIDGIRKAIAAGDGAALRVAAHTLKGSVRYLGADRAFEHAYEIEKMGDAGNLEGAPSMLVSLEGEIAKLTPVLINYLGSPPEES